MNSQQPHHLISKPAASLSSVLELVNRLDNDKIPISGDALRIHVLRNFTLDNLEPYLRYHLYHCGIKGCVTWGNYDTVYQDVISDGFKHDGESPDIIVLALMLEALEPDFEISDWSVRDVSERLVNLFDLLASRTESIVAVNTFLRPFNSESGIGGSADEHTLASRIGQLNHHVRRYAADHASQFFVVDWEWLVMRLGEAASIDRRFWYRAKAPFRTAFLDLYACEVSKIGRALRGKSKKVVALDCDNTLWGGIIGEDGLHGIALDSDEYPGKAFYDFQKSVLHLIKRGVLVALCSKNNEEDVWEVLDNHPHCLIKRDHLAAYRINWDDKARHLSALAEELNLGLESFVFVDDSDLECDLVAELLPGVTVRQVSQKLYDYPSLLLGEGLFDTLTYSQEDRKRTTMYQAETKRKEQADLFQDVESYLASLDLKVTIHPVQEQEVPRVAQLTQKTNQFNLTTKRYSETQIRQFIADPASRAFSLTVQDRFGDYGLTGVLIACQDGACAVMDTLLLSCRVLGRHIEHAFVRHCVEHLNREWNPHEWIADYIPTKKNQQVADFWGQYGFSIEGSLSGKKRYRVNATQLDLKPVDFITITTE